MNLLDLHKENLRDIWSFINDVRDIIRFGSTCKLIRSLAFEVDRDLYINDGAPIELWKYIFSQDLRRLESLTAYLIAYPNKSEYISNVLDILPIISNCRNLKTLSVIITETYEDAAFGPKFQKISAAIKQMTWLEYLCLGFSVEANIGNFFKDHSKLTALMIQNKNIDSVGFELLTQLKSLKICSSSGDQTLGQILDLANLTELDLSWSLVTNETGSQLWKLINLEKLDVTGLERGGLDWRVFQKLPKLSALICARDDNNAVQYEEYQYEVMNSLTQLTSLDVTGGIYEDPYPIEKISNLTNLRELNMELNFPYEDFSKFQHLTYISMTLSSKVERIRLPKGLKKMSIATYSNSDDIFKEIGDLDGLIELGIYCTDPTKLHHISRLANLELLTYREKISPEFLLPLTTLSNLRFLSLWYQPELDIELLQRLTQLNQLHVGAIPKEKMTELRHKLPYAVYSDN